MKEFKDFLFDKLQEYEREQGRRISMVEYAKYLGISRPVLSYYLNGRNTPGIDNAGLLAEKLGIEVYDYLGVTRPDPDLLKLKTLWGKLPAEVRHQLAEQAANYVTKNERKNLSDPAPETP